MLKVSHYLHVYKFTYIINDTYIGKKCHFLTRKFDRHSFTASYRVVCNVYLKKWADNALYRSVLSLTSFSSSLSYSTAPADEPTKRSQPANTKQEVAKWLEQATDEGQHSMN